jgi:hypothetical protein
MNPDTTAWRKSSRSQGGGQNCVEVAVIADSVGIRDSKDPQALVLLTSTGAFRDLVAGIKRGDLDL